MPGVCYTKRVSALDKLTPGWPGKVNVLFDAIVVVIGAWLATFRQVAGDPRYTTIILVGVATWLVGAGALRLYAPATKRTIQDQAALTIVLLIGTSFVLFVWERVGVTEKAAFSVTSFGVICFAWMMAGRVVIFSPLQGVGDPVDDVLIIGTGPVGVATWYRLNEDSPVARRRNVVGFLAFEGEVAHRGLKAPILGRADDILDVLAKRAVAEVFIAGRTLVHGHEMQQIVRACEEVGQPFALPLHALAFERARLLGDTNAAAADGFLHYLSTDTRPMQYAIKRMIDIVASALGLLVLSPLLLGVALIIKLTDRGPIFFKQERVGLHGAHFGMLKFRSMVVNADALKDKLMQQNEMQGGVVFKMKNDPRITAIGRFIRKFSIDELPQLINILRGDMTIVGPRPAVPREVALYKVWQRRRLSVRPGLTCYWQVSGRNEIGFDEWMQLDLKYVDTWNLKIDFELILKTFPVVLTGRGAS